MDIPDFSGLPTPEETAQMVATLQRPQPVQQQGILPDFSGLPSPEETARMIASMGLQPGAPMTAMGIRTQETPEQEAARLGVGYRAGLTAQNYPNGIPAWTFNPIVRGAANMGMGVAQLAAMPLNALTGTDVSGQFTEHQKALEEEYHKKFGKPTPLVERLVTGTVQSLAEIVGIGGAAGPVKYMAAMGARGYDDALKQAKENGLGTAQAHAYATVNAASEVLTEFIPWKKGWGALAEATGVRRAITNSLWHLFIKGGQEAAEEGINQIIQNGNAAMHGMQSWGDWLQGVGEAAAVGGLTGGAIASPAAIQHHRQNGKITPQNPQGQQPAPQPSQAPPATAPAPEAEPPTNPPPAPQEQPHATVPASQQPAPAPVAQPAAEAPPQVAQGQPEAAQPEIGTPLEIVPKGPARGKIKRETMDALIEAGLATDKHEIRKRGLLEDEAQHLLEKHRIEQAMEATQPKPATPPELHPNTTQAPPAPEAPVERPQSAATGPQTPQEQMQPEVDRSKALGVHYEILQMAKQHFTDAGIRQKLLPDMPIQEGLRLIRAVRGDFADWQRTASDETMAQKAPQRVKVEKIKRKPLHEMTLEEARQATIDEKQREDKIDEEVLGPQLSAEYKKAFREQESIDKATAERGSKRIREIEAGFTPEQYNKLYGIGQTEPTSEDYRELQSALGRVDGDTPHQLAESLRPAVMEISGERDPSKWTTKEQIAVAQFRRGMEWAKQKGWDTADLSDKLLRSIATQYRDPNDAEFMVRSVAEKLGVKPPKPKVTGQQPFRLEQPKPETKKQDFGVNKSEGKPLFVGANDIAGQGYMFGEGETLPTNPKNPKRQEAAKKGNAKRAAREQEKEAERVTLRVANEQGVPHEQLVEAVNRELEKDTEHWERLREAVGNLVNLSKEQRKALQEGDETSLKGFSDLDETQERAAKLGLSWDREVFPAIANELPPKPSATDEEYVSKVARTLEPQFGEAHDTDLPENVPGNVEGVSFMRKRAAKSEPAAAKDYYNSLPDFANFVKDLAAKAPAGEKFHENKAFIEPLWRASQRDESFPFVSLDKFKEMLLRANSEHLLHLARADLTPAMNKELVDKSEINHLGGIAQFHFVLTEPSKPEGGVSFLKEGEPNEPADLLNTLKSMAGAAKGTLVSIPELRQKAGLSKSEFDAALVDLARKGDVVLHRIDDAGRLSADQVAQLIHNPRGTSAGYGTHAPGDYYGDVSIRQNTSSAKQSNVPPMAPPAQGPSQAGLPVSGESVPVGENEVREALGKLFGVPIFRGRVKKNAHGTYNWHDQVIRVSNGMWANVVVATHEIGHAIDDQYKFFNNLLTPAAADELLQLDYNPKKSDMREGFAEFIRTYLTTDDAPTVAPNVLDHFEELMAKNPELKSRMEQARAMIDKLRARNPMDVVISQQINGNPVELLEKQGAWDRLKDGWADFTLRYTEMWHNSHIRVLDLAEQADRKLGRSVEGFYNLWNRLSGSDYRRAIAALEHGIHTISGTPKRLSKSVKEIFSMIKPDELDLFSGYVYSQVMRANMARKPGYDPGKTKAELEAAIDEIRTDQDRYKRFDTAARELTKYFHALVDLQAHEGAKSWEEAERIKDSMPDYYAPIFRTEEFGVDIPKRRFGFGQRPGFLNAKATPRKLGQGSSDQYMKLEDAIVKENADAHRVAVQYAMIAPLLRRVLPSLGGAHGLGHLITEVDPKNVMDVVRLGKLLDQLAATVDRNGRTVKPVVDKATVQRIKDVADLRAGNIGKAGLDRLEAEYGTRDEGQLKQMTTDVRSLRDAIAVWKMDFGSSDKEHIIHIHLNGKEILVQFKDHNLWKAMRGIRNLGEADIWSASYAAIAEGIQSKVTRPLQAATVGLNPTAVLRLALLDYPAFLKNSKYTGAIEGFTAPLYNIVRLASAMVYEDVKGKTPKWAQDAIRAVTPELLKGEIKAGLILKGTQSEESGTVTSGKLFGHGRTTLETIKERFLPHDPKEAWYHTLPTKIEHARDYMAAMDSGMRLAEVIGYARSKGYTINKNASFADIEAGKNGWINPQGITVDAPPSDVVAGMLRHNNEVITNYKPKGYVAAEFGKFIPFFTARMAGIHREVSTTKELIGGLARKAQGQDSGVENFGPRIARMASMATAVALYWWFHHDDDDREGMDPSISKRFFTFSSDGIPYAKIPKPRGLDGLFVNAIEGLLDLAVDQKNPEILKTLGITAQDMSPVNANNPVNWPAGVGAIYQVYNNKDWAGRSIDEPWQDEKIATEHQSRPWTLESSKFLSRFLTKYVGLSPAKTEYVLQQMTGSLYGDIVGTTEQIAKRVTEGQPINPRNLPIVRGEAARGLYQRSTGEFYDAYRAMESTVATENHIRTPNTPLNDQEKQDAEHFRQMSRYKQVMSALKKAATEGKDYDKKLELDTYSVGMADYALGKPERESFPNPLKNTDTPVPEPVTKLRQEFLQSLIHSMISDVSIKATIKGGPEKIAHLGERLEKADVQEEWAVQEARRLGYSLADLTRALILQKARAGQKTQYEPDDPHNPFKKLTMAWVKNQTK